MTIIEQIDRLKNLGQTIKTLNEIINRDNGLITDDANTLARFIEGLAEEHMMIEHELESRLGIEVGDYETLYKYIKYEN